ncbi:MAG: TetR/AcrR family transcriptional regulator [Prolixibacteraceae bacterium]
MANTALYTEDKIFKAAYDVFLLYGYHGTTLHQIAILADVHKSAIHYYFRSKEKLYAKVVKAVVDNILRTDIDLIANKLINGKQIWLLHSELYNNQNLFERTLNELYLNDWDKKLKELKELLEIKE